MKTSPLLCHEKILFSWPENHFPCDSHTIQKVQIEELLKVSDSSSPNSEAESHLSLFDFFLSSLFPQDCLSRYSLKTLHQLPKIQKIVVHWSGKRVIGEKKQILSPTVALFLLTGQKLHWTFARQSIATFKLRQSALLGCKVTLRKEKIAAFFEKALFFASPRSRQGERLTLGSLTTRGDFQRGMTEIFLFPELENHFDSFEGLSGFQYTMVVSHSKKKGKREVRKEKLLLLFQGFQWILTEPLFSKKNKR
jgi:large subunit ribosomal protein L5